ncbi:hypothetical protein [Winogradskyella aurantia]|uniref:Uncharacterized protein n=1 Tax=Winogradskyella aurantia TaxID=1915063 RepID=A0A265UT35_9FLAO|nr:hypothetical protein [Winogradskyella aurantia]OZV68475.1 hypothetical protein CA834_08330 [Winogradskyella aurantia]
MVYRCFVFRGQVVGLAFFVLWLCWPFQVLHAQDYEPGYIVLNTNDTLYGSIKNRNDGALYKKIRFKDKHGKVNRYTAENLLGYKAGIYTYESLWYREESQFFKFDYYSRPGYGEKVFLKVLAKGHLSCYAKEFIHDDNDYVDEFELFLRNGDQTMARATQGIFGLKKKRLTGYFWDCPKLVEKINNNTITKPLDVVTYYNEFCGPVKN